MYIIHIALNANNSNYAAFKKSYIIHNINGQILENVNVAKYVYAYILMTIRNGLFMHANHIFEICCRRIEIHVFKRIMFYLPSFVIPMYRSALYQNLFFLFYVIWFNNARRPVKNKSFNTRLFNY